MLKRVELIRLLKRWELYVALAIGFAMIILQAVTIYPDNANFINNAYLHLTGFDGTGIGSNLYYMVLPIMSSLAASSIYSEDKHGKVLNFVLMRTTSRQYMHTTLTTGFVTGGLVGALPLLLEGSYFFTRYSTAKLPVSQDLMLIDKAGWGYHWFMQSPMSYWLFSILITFAFSGLFSLIGIVSSFYIKKKTIEMAVPFIFTMVTFFVANFSGWDPISIPYILPPTFSNDYKNGQYYLLFWFVVGMVIVFVATFYKERQDGLD
ncbi:hypothetical protein ACLJJ6_09745 [Pediococcus siamensis]|uniref:hypothetical protein n=1 Tax=Pediococcus siamensis TaxID=381829 RepID=UPI0039A20BD7